ncbi:MAG: MlaD family protein [Holophagaceae bacterium]|nr:MlaD family protein [Holophagaceae bacterium]
MRLETKVGAFFIASICVVGWLILKVEKISLFNSKPKRVFIASFEQAAGLPKQSKVRVAGVEVGRVIDIQLQHGQALVSFTVDETVEVFANAVANLANIGILGEKYINLIPGKPSEGIALVGSKLTSDTGVGLDAIMESLGEITIDIKGITSALNESIGGTEGKMKLDEIVDNIKGLTSELRAIAQDNHYTLNRTMANVEAITLDFRQRLPVLAKQFEDLGSNLNAMVDENRPEIKGITSEIHKLALGFHDLSDSAKNIMAKMESGEGTIGKLLYDETTITKVNSAVDNLNDMLSGFNNMELRLDMGGASWSDRGDARVGVGLTLAPRHDYWYSIDLASTPDGKIRDETHTITQIDPITGKPTEVASPYRYIKTEQTFTASAQFNKRLGENFVVHAGIIDGTGGGGAEFRAFNDRFRLGALAYDFTKRDNKENPRYRATTSYEFWKGLYAQVGVQDIANKDNRTIFFGGGIRWKDDDIKKLVGLAGAAK